MYSTTVRSVAANRFLEEGSRNVKMRQLIGREDGARKTAMHELIIGKGGYSTMHRHDWDHQLVVTEGRGLVILDFADLKKTLRAILADYDHKDWNAFLEYPTVENICELVSKRLHEKIKFPMHVRIWEGHGKWAEI